MMTLEESCILFQIHDLNKIDKKTLKKKYHKMCLKYHPDKNANHQNKFTKVKECYETLNTYIDNNDDNQKFSYQGKNNSRMNHDNLFATLISLISIDNIKYVINLIDSYKIYMNHTPEMLTLNVTLKQVFDRLVYSNNEHYIPLWHNVVHQFSVKEQKHYVYIINIINIPSNVRILKNNDIIVNIPKENIQENCFNHIHVCDHIEFNIYISSSDCEKAFVILEHKGIPKTNMNNIFDTSQISNIHFHFM